MAAKNLRVLHIIDDLGSGGAEKLLEDSLPLMKDKNIDVEVLLLSNKQNVFGAELKKKAINCYVLPKNKINSPVNIIGIRKHIMNNDFDIVHVHLFPANYWAALASMFLWKKRPTFLYTEHSTHNKRREKKYFSRIEKFIYSKYVSIISISSDVQSNLKEWLNPSAEKNSKFEVINNGINFSNFYNAIPYQKAELVETLKESDKLICMVGRFNVQKDHKTLIKSMMNLPLDIHLILVGEGPLKDKYIEMTKKLGIDKRVHFLGFRKDVEKIVKTCDIVVLSSNWEGFGLAAVEGMAAGKPTIVSDVSGLKEVVKNAGIIFKKGDSNELSHYIKEVFNNDEIYSSYVEKGLSVAKEYDIEIMIEKYIKLYNKIIKL